MQHRLEYDSLRIAHFGGFPGSPAFHAFPITSLLSKQSVGCLVCQDTFDARDCFSAPCGHSFCHACTADWARSAITEGNEDFFPLRCCNQLFSLEEFLAPLPKPLRASAVEKFEEISVPPSERLYCPNDTCAAFIGRSSRGNNVVSCPRCHTAICLECKRVSHAPKPCGPQADDLTREAKKFASQKGWKVCPRCDVIVERHGGCSQMSCRCGMAFCYSCGLKLSSCRC